MNVFNRKSELTNFSKSLDKGVYNRSLFFILLSALVLRILWGLLIDVTPVSDSQAYDSFAQTLSEHGVYGWTADKPSAYWAVGTAAVYAVFYSIFSHDYTPIVIFNLFIGIGSILITMMLTRKWFGDLASLCVGLLLAFWPSQIQFTTVLASELIFNFLMLAALYQLLLKSSSIKNFIIVGVVFALAAYVRPTALLFPFLYGFFYWMQQRDFKQTAIFLAVSCLVMALLIAPWSIRNTQLFGGFVTISTNGGPNMWMGNNPHTTGFYQELPEHTRDMNEYERDKLLREEVRNYIIENPVAFLERTVIKALRLYERETIGVVWNQPGIEKRLGPHAVTPIKIVSQAYWLLCLFLAVVGAWLLLKKEGVMLLFHPAIILIGYFTAVHAIIVIQDRYHFPVIPFLAMLAAVSMTKLYLRFSHRHSA